MIDVLYIAGAGRSGSTLLERLLGQLPQCVAVGEARHLWREDPTTARCGCGRVLTECDHWRAVIERAGFAFDAGGFEAVMSLRQQADRIRYVPQMLVPALAGKTYAHHQAAYTAALRRLYEAFHDVGHAGIVVDSSKDVSTLYLLTQMADVRLRLLHLVRDSRAVAYSWMKRIVRPDIVGREEYMPTFSPGKAAADWMVRNTLTEAARGRADGYLRLRYEDLIADPLATLRRATDFMGLPQADLSFIGPDGEVYLRRETHTVGGNPMKFKAGGMRLRLDDAWQRALRPADRRLVTAATWPLLRRYGYRRDGHRQPDEHTPVEVSPTG